MSLDKKTQFNLWYVFLAIWGVIIAQWFWNQSQQVQTIPYSQFLQLLQEGAVNDLAIRDQTIEGALREPIEGRRRFATTRVDPAIAADLAQHGVTFRGVGENSWVTAILSWVLPTLFFLAVWMFLFRRFADRQGLGGAMSVGKSKAKVYVETDIKVSFDDVAGVDEAKEELREIIAFLNDPKTYGRLGAHIPKGILLVGPPGTGKTLLARAVAGEAKVPFFSISGSEFVEMFVGVGAARVRDLFEQARKAAPCIIFIDELDALGRSRSVGPLIGGHDEKEQTLNQLLAELDGFDPSNGIVLLAATNRPEILDPALMRAGRFDRQVLVDRPDRKGREQILKIHFRKIQCDGSVDLDEVAGLTPGFTGADLANLANESALLATRNRKTAVARDDITQALERIVLGIEKKSRLLNPMERSVVAHHELGHAFVALALPGMDPVHKISIIPRGVGALGYTMQRPTADRFLQTQSELQNRIAVLLGGRAAELLVFSEVSSGAADDLDKATEIARHMVTRFGMAKGLENMTFESQATPFLGDAAFSSLRGREYGEAVADRIDLAMRHIIDQAFNRAYSILKANRAALDCTASQLVAREVLTSEELPAVFAPDDAKLPSVGDSI